MSLLLHPKLYFFFPSKYFNNPKRFQSQLKGHISKIRWINLDYSWMIFMSTPFLLLQLLPKGSSKHPKSFSLKNINCKPSTLSAQTLCFAVSHIFNKNIACLIVFWDFSYVWISLGCQTWTCCFSIHIFHRLEKYIFFNHYESL